MQILLFGKHGQLGWELHRTLAPLGHVFALDIPEVDFSRPESVQDAVLRIKPQVIINASAYTAVDRAEDEPQTAMAVNSYAPGLLASLADDLGAVLIHYSTDYVFDGGKGSPYTESDTPNPLNEYGRSKLAGEKAIQEVDRAYLVLRTSWVYSMRGDSFVSKVLRWSRQQPELRIVSDQIANPTWARMLAEVTSQLIAMAGEDTHAWLYERRGIYHLAGDGYASRMDWAKAILEFDPHREEQLTQEILAAKTTDFPTPARRPLFSALNCDCFADTFGLRLPAWKKALSLAMSVQ
jgi:dTDP-4-dehydrorhamnose reductase